MKIDPDKAEYWFTGALIYVMAACNLAGWFVYFVIR